jgi:Flp pilus assembly protein TadG
MKMHHRIRKIRNGRRWRRFNWLHRFRRDDQGVQLVEIAIVIPILLMLFAAVGEFGRYFYEYTTMAKAARVGARFMAGQSIDSTTTDWVAATKKLVVYGNTAGTGTPVLPGLSVTNVVVTFGGGTYKNGAGVPTTVTVSFVNYKHKPVFDLGKLIKSNKLSLNVDVKPSITMHYMLNANSI